MTTTAAPIHTVADLLERLGGVSPSRVRLLPPPGTATERDVIEVERREDRLCELVDGVLVEKVMGYVESLLAVALAAILDRFVVERNLGLVSGEAGMVRLFAGLVRIPDVAFVSWARVPGGRVPEAPIPQLVPDLAVEILSAGNTPGEMARKLGEYFAAGVRLVWLIDPRNRTVAVHGAPDRVKVLGERDVLDGGEVLKGFRLAVRELFARLDREAGDR